MQSKQFSRQLLDFKARLLLRKTQFPNQIAKWSPEVSPYCKACTDKGDHQIADLKHTLFDCPTTQGIIEHIRVNLTKQIEVRLVNIMFCNNRCLYQTHKTGVQRDNLFKQHDKCALHDKANKHKGTGLDFVWTLYMQSIMNILYKDLTPTPQMILDYIITETKAQI